MGNLGSTMKDITSLQKQFEEQGYLIIRGYFDRETVDRLLGIAESALRQWKKESTKEGEPGGLCHSPKAIFLFNLNHPKYFKERLSDLALLLDAVADPFPVAIMRAILSEEPLFEQASMFLNPENGREQMHQWHRDAQFFSIDDKKLEQKKVLEEAIPARELHFHIPLVKSMATQVVPGSHRRWDTPEEKEIRKNDPTGDAMPNAKILEIDPGDIAFFHVNSIHRGTYPANMPRRTIHCTFGRASMPRPPNREGIRQRNGHYSNYQPWFKEDWYLQGVKPQTRELFSHFIQETEQYWIRDYV